MDNFPFWLSCVVAVASILFSVFASHFFLRKRRPAAAVATSTTVTDAELQKPIPSVSTSPIFPPGSNYQVFLSFHGKDTRTGFTDHLYHGLIDAGICVFRDENDLRVGGEIGPDLVDAITESKIFIPILSQGYASSKWCLQELTQAIALKESSGYIVLPIFYKVEPTHVRHQTGSFGKAFRSLRNKPEAEKWKKALNDVTSMKGWESEKIADGHEGELIKLVVEAVLGELKHDFQLDVPEHLVGIDHHLEKMMGLIDTNSNDTRMIGIYGMGGIGKTTLAKYIFNKLSDEFLHSSFIADIRDKTRQCGIQYLQKQLITDVLGSDTHVFSVDEGINTIKSRFRSKKVLILLDDVDHTSQLDDLTRERTWFGLGSRIIVTTRDKEILDKAKFGVDYKYELQEMNEELSLQLFSIHAFREDSPLSEFMVLSRKMIETTGGLPLALKVIGSLLFGERDVGVWIDTLKKLRSAPPNEVQEKLKISYDALDYEAQQIFLDIACFFIEIEKTYPIYMWDGLNFAPRMRIQILMRKSLIKIERDKFMMHDQLRDLGLNIVRKEDYNDPKNRSRLWDYKEVLNVLNRHEGSEKIRAIRTIDLDHYITGSRSTRECRKEVFEKLPNIRMFDFWGVTFVGDFQNSLSELRWLRWHFSESCSAVTNLHLEQLVILQLWNGKMSNDWAGWSSMKMSSSLKVLELYRCRELRNSPDLSRCTNLEILSLESCAKLERIHPSIGEMKSLTSLKLRSCRSLKELPTEVSKLQKLKQLCIDRTAVREIPEWIDSLKKLETLSAEHCSSLAQIPQSVGHLVNLSNLNLWFCRRLVQIPCSVGNLKSLTKLGMSFTNITKLPESIGHAKNLQELFLSYCYQLEGEIPSEIGNLCSLKILRLNSTRISSLPETIFNLSSLQVLSLEHCDQLGSLPELPSNLTSLQVTCQSNTLPNLLKLIHLKQLTLRNCKSLAFIPNLPSRLSNVVIVGCRKLEKLPNLSNLKLLTELKVCLCSNLIELTGMEGLKSLIRLDVSRCPKLSRFNGLERLELLKYLSMGLEDDEDVFEDNDVVDDGNDDDEAEVDTQFLNGLKFLEELSVSGRNSIKVLNLTQLNSMRNLWATNCQNLVEIQGLSMAAFLVKLDISGCKSMVRLPDLGCFETLEVLDINFCENLRDIQSLEKFSSCRTLCMSGCHSLEKLPDLSNFENLKVLSLKDCKRIIKISSFEKSRSLTYINISGCNSITSLSNLSACKELKCLVAKDCSSLTKLQGLENVGISFLDISGCHLMDPLPDLPGTKLVLNYEAEPPRPPRPSSAELRCITFKR